MQMGVVADDITGSNDIGIMFSKSGLRVHVYPFSLDTTGLPEVQTRPDIIILDTNSRLDDRETAYAKVFAATRTLQASGCRQFFNKTCSVFRGNIGAEFDAMLDALGHEFAVVVLGFPKNGRLTRESIHYVHGRRLEESEFRHDPIHPMRTSNLAEILQAQTRRKVDRLDYTVTAQGPEKLKERIEAMRGRCQYLILDVTSQADLQIIAAAEAAERVLCGSSALAEELPAAWGGFAPHKPDLSLPGSNGLGVLCVAGSLMPQTAGQVEHLRLRGTQAFVLDTQRLFDEKEYTAELERLTGAIGSLLQRGQDAVLHSPMDPASVAQARSEGVRRGLEPTTVARRVSAALSEVTARLVDLYHLNRLAVAGGETSAAVCARLGVAGLEIWKEIQPGLPSCLALGVPDDCAAPDASGAATMLLVLKSGSFGTPEFLVEALAHLKSE